VILPNTAWETWLDPNNRDKDAISALVGSLPVPDLSEYAVSTLVNRVANDTSDLITPLESGAV
jgi:putative SOS response-associated peptidase YedK